MVNKAHRHHDVIVAWANGATIECRDYPNTEWEHCAKPTWHELGEYRVKPEPPEMAYPKTMMTNEVLNDVYDRSHNRLQKLFFPEGELAAVANAAIRHAIDEGQVLRLSGIAAYTEKRDMAVANAMKAEAIRISTAYSTGLGQYILDYLDVNATIAGVKP